MKRDMDLIRLLLLELEGEQVDLTSYTKEQVEYHKFQLVSGDLAHGVLVEGSGMVHPEAIDLSLSWKGHDFLAHTRNEVVWKEAKKELVERGADLSWDLIKAVITRGAIDFFLG